jgi:hypothetical protein
VKGTPIAALIKSPKGRGLSEAQALDEIGMRRGPQYHFFVELLSTSDTLSSFVEFDVIEDLDDKI